MTVGLFIFILLRQQDIFVNNKKYNISVNYMVQKEIFLNLEETFPSSPILQMVCILLGHSTTGHII